MKRSDLTHNVKSSIVNVSVEDRKGTIGGSDVGAVLGFSTYRSPYDVAMAFLGTPEEEERDEASNRRLYYGSKMEAPIAELVECWWHIKCRRVNGAYRRKDHPWAQCHPDRLARYTAEDGTVHNIAVEIKTSNAYDKRWGEEDSSSVPYDYLLQCMWYYICGVPCEEVWLFRCVNNDIERYIIPYDEYMCRWVFENIVSFVSRVEAGDLPEKSSDVGEDFEVIEDAVQADEEMLRIYDEYRELKALVKETEAKMVGLKLRMEKAVDHHSAIVAPGKNGKLRKLFYYIAPTKAFDQKRFVEENPELAEKYQQEKAGYYRF